MFLWGFLLFFFRFNISHLLLLYIILHGAKKFSSGGNYSVDVTKKLKSVMSVPFLMSYYPPRAFSAKTFKNNITIFFEGC